MSQSHTAAEPDEGSDDDREGVERLSALYREYVGEPDQERDIYLGFGLFFAGIVLGAVGFLLFLYSGLQGEGSSFYWQLRELALVAVVLGLPSVVVSIVVLLPVGRRTRALSAVGMGLCIVATGILVSVYPYEWTGEGAIDGSVVTISVYAVGLVILSASTGSALVAQYLDRASSADESGETSESSEAGETVSEDEVADDIEEALDDTTLSWGGVEQQPNTKRLNLNTPEEDPDVDRSSFENVDATTTRSESDDVDDAVAGLRRLQGGESDTARGSSTEDQVDALTEFREQRAEEEIETGVEEQGLLARLRERLFGS